MTFPFIAVVGYRLVIVTSTAAICGSLLTSGNHIYEHLRLPYIIYTAIKE